MRKNVWFTGAGLLIMGLVGASAVGADPLASNNGLYPPYDDPDPTKNYTGPFNIANLDYPSTLPADKVTWTPGGGVVEDALTPDKALAYMNAVKDYLKASSLQPLIDSPDTWDARTAGWYDIVWLGAGDPGAGGGIDPTSGREAIMNTYGGQIVPSNSWAAPYTPTTDWMQNYGVIYYDALAATTLKAVWGDVYEPNLGALSFADGAIVAKIEAATVQPDQWPSPVTGSVLAGAAEWTVFRPTTENQKAHQLDPTVKLVNVVQTVYPFQWAVKIKDSKAAPETGWVFMAFVYDARVKGVTPWDRFVPAGAMWGNDPEAATRPDGRPSDGVLKETWLNPDAPPFFADTLGWGGRLAAPMDVAVRHDVVLPNGQRVTGAAGFRASSCLSCHGTSEYPFTINLYPSPNRTFPPDGTPFPMFEPGSAKWAEWFQNRPGNDAQSPNIGGIGLDYDLSSMFALGSFAAATGQEGFAFDRFHVHH